MFSKFSEQLKKSAQPTANLFEINAKALELLSAKQTELFSGVMTDSVKLLNVLAEENELNGIFVAQRMYAESLIERVKGSSQETFSELDGLRAEMTDFVKNSFENVSEHNKTAISEAQSLTTPAKATVSEKPAPAKKAAAKKTVSKKAAPAKAAVKATPAKAAVKATPAKAEAVKATPAKAEAVKATPAKAEAVKAAPAKAEAVKAAPAKTTAVQATPAKAEPVKAVKTESQVKTEASAPAAKTVANLSPADVKAAD